MVMVPRPLTAISASMAAAGPKASTVTMRRSKSSAPCSPGGAAVIAVGAALPDPNPNRFPPKGTESPLAAATPTWPR